MSIPKMASNSGGPAYISRSRWSPERPETLVVCCSDGRWHAPIHEFVEQEISSRADLFVVPGGPAAFDPWNSSFDENRVLGNALRLFAEHHDLHSVWLIQHEGCAYYRDKHSLLDEKGLMTRQMADLCRAAVLLTASHPKLKVRAFLALLQEQRAVFHEIDTTSHPGVRLTGVSPPSNFTGYPGEPAIPVVPPIPHRD